MILELVHPELLLLILLLGLLWILLPLWRPRIARRQPVATTALWHRAIPESGNERPIWPLLLAFALIIIASGPRIVIEENPSVAARRVNDGEILIDIRAPGATEGSIRTAGQEPRNFLLSTAGEGVINSGNLLPGTKIEVVVNEVAHKLIAPTRNAKVVVSDLSNLPQVADALEVLKEAGRIEISSNLPDVVIQRGASTDSSLPSIRFPESEGNLILPTISPPTNRPLLLDGLHPRYWTVLRAREVAGDPLLIDEAGRPLLSRSDTGFSWGFLPGSGDLAQRSDWPVLLGRFIEELTASETTRTESKVLPFLGMHLATILSLLVTILIPLVLGSQGKLPALCVLLAIVSGQFFPEVKRTPEGTDLDLFSASEAPATTLQVPSHSAPVSPELQRLIRSRGISIELEKLDESQWKVIPERIRSGQSVSMEGVRSNDSFQAISPAGQRLEIPSPWNPTTTGAWLIESTNGKKRTLIIEDPIPSALWAPEESAALNLLPTPTFSTKSSVGLFPEPAAGSVIVWNSVVLDQQIVDQLRDWISRGGTFLALPADPFCEDEKTRQILASVLPTIVPPPPTPPVEDLGILLLDLSGSLAGSGASTLLAGTLSILEGSSQNSLWGIAGFRDKPSWIFPPGTRIDRAVLTSVGEQITTGGGTDLGSALRFSLETLKNRTGGKSLVVITDGRSTPDDWEDLGTKIQDLDIDLHMLLVGDSIDLGAIEVLRNSSTGRVYRAETPQQARALLDEIVKPKEQGWQPVQSPVLVASLDDFLESAPARPPIPSRRIALDSESISASSKYLWVDGAGSPLLAIRSTGKGVSAIWFSGLDEFSLARKSSEIMAQLSQLIAGSADRRKETRRRGFLVQGLRGQTQLALKRAAEDPLSIDISWGAIGSPSVSNTATASPGTDWFLTPIPEGLSASGIWWQQGRSIDAGVFPVEGNIRKWNSILGARHREILRLHPPSVYLLLLAILLLLSNRGNHWLDLLRQQDTEPAKARRY